MKVYELEDYPYGGRMLKTAVIVKGESLELLASLFLLERAFDSKAFNSIKANAEDLCSFLTVVDESSGDLTVTNVSREQMHAYIHSYLSDTRGLSKKTLNRHCSTLKLFYDWLYKAGFINEPKRFNFPKFNTPSRSSGSDVGSKYISESEYILLAQNVLGKTPFIRSRNELILEFGYHCGLRAHELTENLKYLNSRLIQDKVNNAAMKQEASIRLDIVGKGSKIRTIIVPPNLLMKLKKYLDRRSKFSDGPLICSDTGGKLNSQFASKVFSDSVRSMCSEDRELFKSKTFHCLRHSYATNLVAYCFKEGRDPFAILPDLLGHEDRETSLKYIAWDGYLNNRTDIIGKLSLEKAGNTEIE